MGDLNVYDDPLPRKIADQELSRVPASEREAELQNALANRLQDMRSEVDDRLTWQQLYDMFVRHPKVSRKQATDWADRITYMGVIPSGLRRFRR